MPDVERRRSVLQSKIVHVGRPGSLSAGAEECRLVVQRLTQCVRSLEEDAVPSLIFRGQHHAVVIRVDEILPGADRTKERNGKNLFIGRLVAALGWIAHDHCWLILIQKQPEMAAAGALIVGL